MRFQATFHSAKTLIKYLLAIGVGVAVYLWCWLPVKSDPKILIEEPAIDQAALLDAHVGDLTDAIYGAEGRCEDLHGRSGEYGCFQYLPSTWRSYSLSVAGEVLPQTRANERLVTEGMIRSWVEAGKSDRWIFLQWNQGNGDGWGPGTKDCYAGVNSAGVAYDSCDYAERGLILLAAIRAERLSLLSLELVQR